MGRMNKVAVIILNWNGWPDTLACMHALTALEYPDYEVLVVDNGSSDDSIIRIREVYPNASIIENERNLGFGGGCNVGIHHALSRGADFIWLLNNDTRVEPDTLSALMNVALSDPKIGAVGSVLFYMDAPGNIQAWGGGWVNLWSGLSRHAKQATMGRELHYITAASVLLRREALLSVGAFDDKNFFMYWEDADLCFRLRRGGWRLAVAPQARVWHKESASLKDRKPLLDKYYNTSSVRFLRRYAPLPWIPIIFSSAARLFRRAIRGDWPRVRAVWDGIVEGAREPA
ncbi:MAG: glycosyltransferase family 2 protein [Pseudomonadota bacterium]